MYDKAWEEEGIKVTFTVTSRRFRRLEVTVKKWSFALKYLQILHPEIQQPEDVGSEVQGKDLDFGVKFYARTVDGIPQWYLVQWVNTAQLSGCINENTARASYTFFKKK